MPSPFPGMDPFIEFQLWDDFHDRFVADLADALVPQVRPNYVVRYERRVYVEHDPDDPDRQVIIPDATILAGDRIKAEGRSPQETATATLAAPVEVTLPLPVTKREAFLTVRERDTLEVVTVLELLSPGNKRPGSDGRREYLTKRDTVLQSPANLVELDLLRGGVRLPTIEPLPPADYYAFVCRASRRPKADVYAWTVRDPLSPIPIPLARDDSDARLDLQALFTARYERSGYDYSMSYEITAEPPFRDEDAAWAQQVLQQAHSAR